MTSVRRFAFHYYYNYYVLVSAEENIIMYSIILYAGLAETGDVHAGDHGKTK